MNIDNISNMYISYLSSQKNDLPSQTLYNIQTEERLQTSNCIQDTKYKVKIKTKYKCSNYKLPVFKRNCGRGEHQDSQADRLDQRHSH